MQWSSCATVCITAGALFIFLVADIRVSLTPEGRCEATSALSGVFVMHRAFKKMEKGSTNSCTSDSPRIVHIAVSIK